MSLFPAHAGVIPSSFHPQRAQAAFPSTRGGDPTFKGVDFSTDPFSPHARG